MPLAKSIPLKPGTPILIESKRTGEILLEYTVPDEYFAVLHITVDLFKKPSGLALPKTNRPGETH